MVAWAPAPWRSCVHSGPRQRQKNEHQREDGPASLFITGEIASALVSSEFTNKCLRS